jgi:hypothetical protein
MAYILPYIEQNNAYQQAKTFANGGGTNWYAWYNPVCELNMKMFNCPSDSRGEIKFPGRSSYGGSYVDYALTGYLGNSGTTSTSMDGLLYYESKITLVQIPDGTSNTILVGERPPNSNMEFGWWFAAYGYDGRGTGDCVMTSNDVAIANYFIANYNAAPNLPCDTTDPTLKIGLRTGHPDRGCDAAHYWSFHEAGSHFLMGDGSVNMMTYGNNNIIPALSTRDGGEVAVTQ